MTAPTVAVVGLGLGQPRLDDAAEEAVARADVLVGGARQLAAFADHPGQRIPIAAPLSQALDAMAAARDAGLRLVVLADGDPLYFGIGRALLNRFGPDALVFYPNVTAVAAAAARLKRPWQDLAVASLHGRQDFTPLFAALSQSGAAMAYTDAANTPAIIAASVLDRAGDVFTATVLENLGLPDERVRHLSLAEAASLEFSPLNLIYLERTRPPEVPLALGLADHALLRQDAVFTKAPVRAVSLAALSPRPGHVIWDIGAGTGTVALEASLLNAGGPVLAVERDPDRHALLARNIQRTGALTVRPVLGQAPDCFGHLPDPDRVFVGGGLSEHPGLLAAMGSRLRPGGRLVANTVLLGSLERAMAELVRLGFSTTLTQVQASLSTPLAGDVRLRAGNPVFILAAAKDDHA